MKLGQYRPMLLPLTQARPFPRPSKSTTTGSVPRGALKVAYKNKNKKHIYIYMSMHEATCN
jgi:hypothetical protein